MNKHRIDTQFRKRLGDYDSPVPAGLWHTIESQLPPPPASNRRWLALLLFLGLITLTGALVVTDDALWASLDGSEKNAAMSDASVQFALINESAGEADLGSNQTQINLTSSDLQVEQTSSAVGTNAENEEVFRSAETSNSIKTDQQQEEIRNAETSASINSDQRKEGFKIKGAATHTKDLRSDFPSANNNNSLRTKPHTPLRNPNTRTNDAVGIMDHTESGEQLADSDLSLGGKAENTELNSEQEFAEVAVAAPGSARQSRSLLNVPQLALPLSAESAPLDIDDATIQKLQTDCFKFSGGMPGNILLDVYGGPFMGMRSLTSRTEDVSEYIRQREDTESSRLSWHAGLRASYQFANGFAARIGVHYSQLIELFEYSGDEARFEIIQPIDPVTMEPVGPPDTVLVTGTRIKKTYNRFHTIDIPLLAGYHIENGDWSFDFSAGPVFNVAFIKKGDILSSSLQPVSISSDNSNEYPAFKDNLGLSVYGSATALRRVAFNLYAFVEPHVMVRLDPITLDSYPIEQKASQVGLSFGLRLKL